MAKTIEQILGYQNLTGIITSPKGGVPSDVLPSGFFSGPTKQVEGNTGSYTRIEGNRSIARIVAYGSASQRRDLKDIAEVPVVLAHSNEHIFHNANTLIALRNFDNPMIQAKGAAIVAQRTAQFRMGFNNLRLTMAYMALAKGFVYADQQGFIQPTSGGAYITVNYQIPTNHLDQTGVGAWNNAATDIPTQVQAIDTVLENDSGYTSELAIYGPGLIGIFQNNNYCANIIRGNAMYAQKFAENTIPEGFLGKTWVPARKAYFIDKNGVSQRLWGTNQVTFCPMPSIEWWEWLEGSLPIPTTVGNVNADGTAALGDISVVYGMGSYALISADPVGIKHIAFDTMLPAIKVPKAMRIVPDVTAAAT